MFLRFFLLTVIVTLAFWYLHEFHTAEFIKVTRNIPYISPFMVKVHSWIGSKKSVKEENNDSFRLFTKDELKFYDGNHDKGIYIAILGKVFDVSKGKKHYAAGGTYHTFSGRDNSRAFITGEFDLDKGSDDVLDLPLSDILALSNWIDFYHKDYKYKGTLVGRFYNEKGEKTDYLKALEIKIEEAKNEVSVKERNKRAFPPCNVEWTAERGSRVWCSSRSGGIDRNWIGVPRKLYEVGSDGYHCVCINLPELEVPDSPQYYMRFNLAEYEGCAPNSTTCYYET